MLATNIPKLIKDAIIKCHRSFFWANGRDNGGGSCVVAWKDVCRMTDLGGLGVLDIKSMSWALRARWPWLGRTDATRPWANFPIKCNRNITSLLHAATVVKLGNGSKALFWTDRCLDGQSISDLAPRVFAAVSTRASKNQKVATALPENAWIQDITTSLSADGIVQFLNLVEILGAQQTKGHFFWASAYTEASLCISVEISTGGEKLSKTDITLLLSLWSLDC
jgi:hypothetical protein